MSETHYCRDCGAAVLLRDAEGHADKCPAALASERDALREYLNDICDAYEAWQKACDSPPGSDISGPEYEAHDFEMTARRNAVDDAIQAACDARQEP